MRRQQILYTVDSQRQFSTPRYWKVWKRCYKILSSSSVVAPAELQLVFAVLKVHVVHGMPDVSAPVTSLIPFEVGTPTLGEAHLGTERFLSSRRLQGEELLVAGHLLAPSTHSTARGDARRICRHTLSWHNSITSNAINISRGKTLFIPNCIQHSSSWEVMPLLPYSQKTIEVYKNFEKNICRSCAHKLRTTLYGVGGREYSSTQSELDTRCMNDTHE
jgi:hypothetical protein